jgi:hypothetical protein
VNALVSAAALPFGWILARRWGGQRAAWWMVVLLFSSPLLWFYASQPLSYGTELGWVMAIACCAWFVAEGDPLPRQERLWRRWFIALWVLPSAFYLLVVQVLTLQCALVLLVPADRFLENLRSYDRDWSLAIRAVKRFDPATTLVVVTGRSNRRAYRLPSVHLPAYDHGEADPVLDQRDESIKMHPPLQQVRLRDRGLSVQPGDVPGGRFEALIPGRLQLIEVAVPASGLEVFRRQVKPLRPTQPAPSDSAPSESAPSP